MQSLKDYIHLNNIKRDQIGCAFFYKTIRVMGLPCYLELPKYKEPRLFDIASIEEYREMVKIHNTVLYHIRNQTEELCLEAVRLHPNTLRYVREQTEEICLEAVRRRGSALKFVHEQTDTICLEAVKQDGLALLYVRNQTEEICIEALKNTQISIGYVDPIVYENSIGNYIIQESLIFN